MKVLAAEGLIELFPNRSPSVAPITRENVGELFDVMAWLERYAGELTAARVEEKTSSAFASAWPKWSVSTIARIASNIFGRLLLEHSRETGHRVKELLSSGADTKDVQPSA